MSLIKKRDITLTQLEKKIGYKFMNDKLFSSLKPIAHMRTNEMNKEDNNERLEFLGDAVLGRLPANVIIHLTLSED